MAVYYITPQLVFVETDESPKTYDDHGMMKFRASVYTNPLNDNPRADFLAGLRIQNNVMVSIPVNTIKITT